MKYEVFTNSIEKTNMNVSKKRIYGTFMAIVCLAPSLFFLSCGGNKDKAIMAAIDSKKKEMKDLAGISATVEKGTVTLSGECPDSSARTMCEESITAIPGVEKVVNNVSVPPPPPAPAPVTITADDPLTKGVNDAIKDYPGVTAAVKDGVVTLTGDIKRASLQKLMMTLHTLKPKKINNQLTIK